MAVWWFVFYRWMSFSAKRSTVHHDDNNSWVHLVKQIKQIVFITSSTKNNGSTVAMFIFCAVHNKRNKCTICWIRRFSTATNSYCLWRYWFFHFCFLPLMRSKWQFSYKFFNFSANVNDIVVTWSTMDDPSTDSSSVNSSIVEYGINGYIVTAYGTTEKFVDGGAARHTQYIHRVSDWPKKDLWISSIC